MSFFKDDTGNWNFGALGAVFAAIVVIASIFFGHELVYNFTHRFWRAGVWGVVGIVAGLSTWYAYKKLYIDRDNMAAGAPLTFVGGLLILAGLWGPAVFLKSERASSIPDTPIYWSNGKVRNATDPSQADYYFKQITLSPEDSVYVVVNGEEPGYNNTFAPVRNGVDTLDISTKPRANENWTRPKTNEAKKLQGVY